MLYQLSYGHHKEQELEVIGNAARKSNEFLRRFNKGYQVPFSNRSL